MQETIDRLDRRYKQLTRQGDDVDFLRQLPIYLDALDAEGPSRRILKLLRGDVERAVEEFNATERDLMHEAVAIRQRLAKEAPEIDNSDLEEPALPTHAHGQWTLNSFANFDRLAVSTRRLEFEALPYHETSDKTPLATMLIILRGRLRVAQHGEENVILEDTMNRRPDLDDFHRQIHNLLEKHAAARSRFREQSRSLPGVAEGRLRAFVAIREPKPFLIDEEDDDDSVAERAFLRGVQQLGIVGIQQSALAGLKLEAGEQEVLRRAVAFLRGEAERLHEEIVSRLARGEGQGKARRTLVFIGQGSSKVGLLIAATALTTIVGLVVTAYATNWLGDDEGALPTRTAERLYQPFVTMDRLSEDLKVRRRWRSGDCEPFSNANAGNPNAARCFAAEEAGATDPTALLDPCFAATGLAVGVEVVCPLAPWAHEVNVVSVTKAADPFVPETAKQRDDVENRLTNALPWALELANGQGCLFVTGASNEVAGRRVNYVCWRLGGPMGYEEMGGVVAGEPDRSEPLWRIQFSELGSSEFREVSVIVSWS